jgi:sulfite exporter TauE/SafE
MCGPLSLALPVQTLSPARKFLSLLFYQFGRVITYSLLGLLIGLAGRRLYLAGYQQWFSIILGGLVLLLAIGYFGKNYLPSGSWLRGFYGMIQRLIGQLMRRARHLPGFMLLGMANGLLPCGMVYIALAATFSFSEVAESVGFMAGFGAGTLPAMMAVAWAGTRISLQTRVLLRKAVPFFVMAVGVLLILRGLNLGIPYISPALPADPGTALECHPN